MEDLNQNLDTQIQEGNTGQKLPYHTHNGTDSPIITVSESSLNLGDITTGDATTSRHGFLPKLSGVATEFLDGTGDYDTVKDSDLSTSDVTDNNVSTSKHGFVPKAPNNTTTFLRGDASWAAPTVSSITVTVTAGEKILAGDIVKLYIAGNTQADRGYQQTAFAIYAIRAAANNTTYGDTVLGIADENITYLSTGRVTVAGASSQFSGLTATSTYYLDNYAAASSLDSANTQTSQDAEFNVLSTNTLQQLWIPTSSLLDKVTFLARRNGGASADLTVDVYRVNSLLGTATINLGVNSGTLLEKTGTFTPAIRTYKGEILQFRITASSDFCYIGYKSGGDVYQPVYGPSGSGGSLDLTVLAGSGSIPAASDLYMKIYEHANFGKLNTTAGTRKIKVGQAITTSQLAYLLQYGDSIL